MASVTYKVAQDGSGNFRSVQEAVNAVSENNRNRVLIYVKSGVYHEPVYIPKRRYHIMLIGEDAHTTVLSYDNTATKINHPFGENVRGKGTFGSGSVIVEGDDFVAQNITFANTAPQGSGQAVALRLSADRCAFYGCRFHGWQDTLYLHRGRVYIKDCYIEGSVDYIFGNAAAFIEKCHVHSKSDKGFVTAQQRREPSEATGYVFLDCVLTGDKKGSSYLGRPWAPHARVLFARTYLSDVVHPEGWHNWDDPQKEKTAVYMEWRCWGPGADRSARKRWSRDISDQEAAQYIKRSFVDAEGTWLKTLPEKIPSSALHHNFLK